VVTVGNSRQRAEVRFAPFDDLVEGLRPVADLKNRHADAGQRQQVALRLLEDFDRQNRRPGRKVEDTSHGGHLYGLY
jgi:hypothetical protein